MILYLRDNNKRTIAEVEVWVKKEMERSYVEISSDIIILPYSEFLLNNLDKKDEIIEIFNEVSNLRGWMWETFFMVDDNTPEMLNEVLSTVKKYLKVIGDTFNLTYIED